MLIASRELRVMGASGELVVPVRLYRPEQSGQAWSCSCEIDWPDGRSASAAFGLDAVQALTLALQMIGAKIYTSEAHRTQRLRWTEPGQGYGFPISDNLRDLLIGDDRRD